MSDYVPYHPTEAPFDGGGRFRQSWLTWFQDFIDAIRNRGDSIDSIERTLVKQVAPSEVADHQKYPQDYEVVLSEDTSILTIPYFLPNSTQVYTQRGRIGTNTSFEIYYREVTNEDGTRNRIEFNTPVPTGTEIVVSYYEA